MPEPQPGDTLPADAIEAAAVDDLTEWMTQWAWLRDLDGRALPDEWIPGICRSIVSVVFETAAPALRAQGAAAERERIVKWLHAEAVDLAHDKPGLTDLQRSAREDTSQGLLAAIAHMSAYGLLDAE